MHVVLTGDIQVQERMRVAVLPAGNDTLDLHDFLQVEIDARMVSPGEDRQQAAGQRQQAQAASDNVAVF